MTYVKSQCGSTCYMLAISALERQEREPLRLDSESAWPVRDPVSKKEEEKDHA